MKILLLGWNFQSDFSDKFKVWLIVSLASLHWIDMTGNHVFDSRVSVNIILLCDALRK